MSTPTPDGEALYYPFHLCPDETLRRLLERYRTVHFRDFMALQLTPTIGTTAYADRMGQFHPELVQQGRIVQGHSVSGPLAPDMVSAIDRDLADPEWRSEFHDAFRSDRRFQRGLLDATHGMRLGDTVVPGPAVVLELMQESRRHRPYTVQRVRDLSRASPKEAAYDLEYGWALVKTSAALLHTVRLCRQYGLEAVTDSRPHYELLERTCQRDRIQLLNTWSPREGS